MLKFSRICSFYSKLISRPGFNFNFGWMSELKSLESQTSKGQIGYGPISNKVSIRCYCQRPRRQTPRMKPNKTNRKLLIGAYSLLVIPGTAFSLAIWQMKRKNWKLDLIDRMEQNLLSDPINLPESVNSIEDIEYTPVKVIGKFDHSRELYLGPRSLIIDSHLSVPTDLSQSSLGYQVITPFILSDRKWTILVNRGWVSEKRKDPLNRKSAQIEDEIELVGIVRKSEYNPYISMKSDEKTFFKRDIGVMAEEARTDPVYIEADYASSISDGPIGGQTFTNIRNKHQEYVITWLVVGFISLSFWLYWFRRPPLPDSAHLYFYNLKRQMRRI